MRTATISCFFALLCAAQIIAGCGGNSASAPARDVEAGAVHPAAPRAAPPVQSWMSREVGEAWQEGYTGQGTTVHVIDDFESSTLHDGDLGLGSAARRHGEWTAKQASMIAPSATMRTQNFSNGAAVELNRGLNVANLSYGMFSKARFNVDQMRWLDREASLITYAHEGRAVIAKAAGNDGVAVGSRTAEGSQDYLNVALIGSPSAIFVGALERNGTASEPAPLARYSNTAGGSAQVQNQFLVVGVEGDKTGLYGTSYAAPIVSGYAAILGSKFTRASPTQIANQLLSTARSDTVVGYDATVHGRGEASISRALAPRSIE